MVTKEDDKNDYTRADWNKALWDLGVKPQKKYVFDSEKFMFDSSAN